jgi:hypothetical protein
MAGRGNLDLRGSGYGKILNRPILAALELQLSNQIRAAATPVPGAG